MSNRKTNYRNIDKWRETIKKQHFRYYKKYSDNNKNSGLKYTEEEESLILSMEIPDIEIAKKLNRTLRAIQIKRSRLKRKLNGS